MNPDVIRLTQEALWLILLLSAPSIIAASVFGLLVAFLQSITQLQEQTIAFAVKLAVIGATLFLTAGLMAENLLQFTDQIFRDFPILARQ
ncbi:type III secretion system export apparatus subunit SctS [Allohahella sp. A8]|uniref:type III secretion system export apparatus subunit SctS n=1 Tax=Allohahella sp. A8 TaxID=3141461 RepID=UPI000C09F26E|nr:EscS/YscS/HrcS family type III secretion system export apparatus protein [Hahellaceae bacterium]|tara:strand:+ start:32613 stop:32882 length:270 start_codon:yes stop_codon:yes gene_type:complete